MGRDILSSVLRPDERFAETAIEAELGIVIEPELATIHAAVPSGVVVLVSPTEEIADLPRW